MVDVQKYLKIKYKLGGRGFEEGDCFNMILSFYKNELGIELKDYEEDYKEDWYLQNNFFVDLARKWGFVKVPIPRFGDVILFKVGNYVRHCGVISNVNEFEFIHTGKDGTYKNNFVTDRQWASRVFGFYRHKKVLNEN